MKTTRAVTAGLIGAVVMTAIMWMGRTLMDMPANLEMMLGTKSAQP